MSRRPPGRRFVPAWSLPLFVLVGPWALGLLSPGDSPDGSAPQPAALSAAPLTQADLVEAGREQFTRVRHAEVAADPDRTAHRAFNARSCAECHRQGGIGGGGPNENNVQLLDLAFSIIHPQVTRLFHKNSGVAVLPRRSLSQDYADWRIRLLERADFNNPEVVLRRPKGEAPVETDLQAPESLGAGVLLLVDAVEERNTPPLFGLGAIESIPQSAIDEVAWKQSMVVRGRSPRVRGGGFGRFGWKSNTASLLAFNENACAVELGLTTPNFHPTLVRDAELGLDPRTATEGMMGTRGTISRISPGLLHAYCLPIEPVIPAPLPSAPPEISASDVAALTRFVANLPVPRQVIDPAKRELVAAGERHFHAIGCAACHTPNLGEVRGLYSDLLLHSVGSSGATYYGEPSEPQPADGSDFVRASEFRTPPLWGVADSGPYLHDGSAATLDAAIDGHRLQAEESAKAYRDVLHASEQKALLAFLESLRAP